MSVTSPPDPDDAIGHYMDHLENSGRTLGTVRSYRTSFRAFRPFLDEHDLDPDEVTERDCMTFLASLRDDYAPHTVKRYASHVNQFYRFYSDRGTFETNPMAIALDEVQIEANSSQHRREISLEEMQEFIDTVNHPQKLAIVVLLAKTGIRAGELCNLDLRDLYIDHQGARRELPKPRTELDGKPDSLFIDNSHLDEGDVVNGERRDVGNKRKNETIIPLDSELKQVLLYWLAVRPSSPSKAEPLFILTAASNTKKSIGARITKNALGSMIRRLVEPFGWYTTGGGVQNNVTPHYFRHWFTTMAEQSGMPRTIVKYIRGDVGSDIVDQSYRHFWGSEVSDEYLNHIYSLL